MNPLKNVKWLSPDSTKKLYILKGINREIIPNQVTKLCKSLKKMGCIRPVLTVSLSFLEGVKRTYVIDGQHLLNALIRMNESIPVAEIEVTDVKDLIEKIAFLNASSKSWTMDDYTLAWSYLEDDYKKLRKFKQVYDIEIGTLASILQGLSGSNSTSDRIKRGEFRIINEKENLEILNHLRDVLLIIPRENRWKDKFVCSEFTKFYRDSRSSYNHERFLSLLKKNIENFKTVGQQEGSLVEQFKKLK